ncbi:MAG: hypothetical protein ACW960_13125 [Candidatus Thorarchaeota archaeon]|jgi:hypothetical protein
MQADLTALIRLDLLFESVSGIIAMIIAYYATKAYNLTEQKRLSDLSTGFLVLSIAMFSHVIGTWYRYVSLGVEGPIHESTTTVTVVTLTYHFLQIMAYVLFILATRRGARGVKQPEMAMLMALPILIDVNLELITIFVMLVVVLQALLNYATVRSRFALYVLVGFFLIFLSHIFLITAEENVFRYLVSQALQLLGFLTLLLMVYKVGRVE